MVGSFKSQERQLCRKGRGSFSAMETKRLFFKLPCFEATYHGFHGFQPMPFALSEGVS